MRLEVDIDTDDPPSGWVQILGAAPPQAVSFEGWLGLVAVVRALQEAGQEPRPLPGAP